MRWLTAKRIDDESLVMGLLEPAILLLLIAMIAALVGLF
jgi:hypothetical protein